MRRSGLAIALALGGLVLGGDPVEAHPTSNAYLRWATIPGGAQASLQVSAFDAHVLSVAGRSLEAAAPARLRLLSAGGPCAPSGPAARHPAEDDRVVVQWRVECPGPALEAVEADLLFDLVAGHVTLVRVEADGVSRDLVLSEAHRRVALRATPLSSEPTPRGLRAFFELGLEHILGGWDHLAFLLVLLVARRGRPRAGLLAVTGFTVGHGTTLALMATGALEARGTAVEALIALSVLFAALESWGRAASMILVVGGLGAGLALLGDGPGPLAVLGLAAFCAAHARLPTSSPVALAGAFGLLHGLGFASGLRALVRDGDVPLMALLGFNLGVEAGQLAVAAVLWPALVMGGAKGRSLAIGVAAGLGAYWSVLRLLP